MCIGQIRDQCFSWLCVKAGLHGAGVREDIVVRELNTLGVASRTRRVAEDVHIVLLRFNETWSTVRRRHHSVESTDFNLNFLRLSKQSWLDIFCSNESLHELGLARLFESNKLLYVVLRANESAHLRLIENKIDLLTRHGIIEANSRYLVVHACQQSRSPLPSILGPDTTEAPLFAFAFSFRAQVQVHKTLG